MRWLCGWKAHSGIEEGLVDEVRAGAGCLLVCEVLRVSMRLPCSCCMRQYGMKVKLDIHIAKLDIRSAQRRRFHKIQR